jgi:hypothetical protein
MIIDTILNRKDGRNIYINGNGNARATSLYNAKNFYTDVMQYGEIGHKIAEALDNGQECDVKQALCNYINYNEYNPAICEYINSVQWIESDNDIVSDESEHEPSKMPESPLLD